jgi:toxin secretion/phage lysis holin
MEKLDVIIKSTVGGIGFIISAMVGGLGLAFTVLLAFQAIDIITGLMVGWKGEGVSSSVGIKGLFKKLYILLLIGSVYLLGLVVELAEFAGDGVTVAFIVMEFISIVENGGKLGVKLPTVVQNGIQALKGDK